MRSASKRHGVEMLETKHLLSTVSVSAAGLHSSHLDHARAALGAAEIGPGVIELSRPVIPSARQIVRVHYDAAVTTSSDDSGASLQPRDPGGVELDQTGDSGELVGFLHQKCLTALGRTLAEC